MTPRRRATGFTLIEVLAAVAVLALLFTILAEVAIVGLRSEGLDRRRAEAGLIADRELAVLETTLASGQPVESGVTTHEEDEFRIAVELAPEDVMALLPAALRADLEDDELETMLVDDRGQSRIRKLRVRVEWDESEAPESVERTSYHLDTSELAALFPEQAEGDANDGGEGDDEDEIPSLEDRLRSNEDIDLEALLRETGDVE